MAEHPIIFSGPMVRAILDGRKSQTRRVMRPQPDPEFLARGVVGVVPQWPQQDGVRWFMADGLSELVPCRYGGPGDLLIPRTTWATEPTYDDTKPTQLPDSARIWSYWDSAEPPEWTGKGRPGRFLPKRFWHLLPRLVNKDVRVERVQEISEGDAMAEGVESDGVCGSWIRPWSLLWDSINAKRGFGWDVNPWVWAVTFEPEGA